MVTRRTTTKKRVNVPARLLSLAPYPPFLICPPMSGGALHIIKPLIVLGSTGDYHVSLLFPASSQEHVHQVKSYLEDRQGFVKAEGVVCQKQWNDTLGVRDWVPDGALYLYGSPQYREALKRILQDGHYDIVVVETSYMAWTIPLIREAQPKARIVLDLQNVEHLLMRRMIKNGNLSGQAREKYLSEYHKTLNWEKKFWPSFDYCMAVSPLEAGFFSTFAPGVPVEVMVAGGGVGTDEMQNRPYPGISPYDLAYVGTMWYPNLHGLLWFIEKVLPRVRIRYPNTKLHIVGSGSPSGKLLSAINGQKSVVFWGQRRDERGILAGAGVFVVPLFIGAGTRIKIMTAWSLEIPVVSTTIGAEGLSCKQGIDILIADSPDEFADCIIRLLSDPLMKEAVGRNGRRLVEEMYSEQVARDKTINFFNYITKGKPKNK